MALGLKRIHWLVVVGCLLGVNALGQQAGQIVGVVTDSSGGVLPAITITAKEVGTGFSQSTATGEDGGSDKQVWFNPAAFAVNIPGTFGSIGTGAFYGPHLCSFDMGFFKNTQINERVSVQFRAEMFNIFNQTNFDNPNSNLSGADFGRIVQTNRIAGDPRIIQFALKILF